VISRPSFEAQLSQFYNPKFPNDADLSAYAMRHTIFAHGKRALLRKEGIKTFQEIHAESWPYMANALSVHTELLYMRSSITAIQALFLMVRFSNTRPTTASSSCGVANTND
jgi:predicted lipoprotein